MTYKISLKPLDSFRSNSRIGHTIRNKLKQSYTNYILALTLYRNVKTEQSRQLALFVTILPYTLLVSEESKYNICPIDNF